MRRLLYPALAALAVAACGSLPSSDIEGEWQLVSGTLDGQPVSLVRDHPITLMLASGDLDGVAACNDYGGTYRIDDDLFSITTFEITEMGCNPPEVMTSEDQYRSALFNVESAEISSGSLVMKGSRAELRFVPIDGSSSATGESPAEPLGLFGLDTFGSWELVSGESDGRPIPMVESHPITIEIDEDGVGGTAACNHYFASPGGGFGQTEMLCFPDEVMDSESAYLVALARVTRSGTGGQLVLTGEGVELVFRPLAPVPQEELLNTVWVLESLIHGDAVTSTVADTRATLELFTDGSFIGSTGCRTIAGSYLVSGAEVVFTTLGAEGECPPELEDQDSRVISALEGGFRVEISENRMTTWVHGDEGLMFRAEE